MNSRAFVLAAAVMTRPEMAFLAAGTGAFFLAQAIVGRDARRWRHFAGFCGIFALLAGAWFIWRWRYYGYVFPTIVGRGNVVGAQFHPEKSQHAGIELLSAFAGWAP